jgi:hypothetical protein
MGKITCTPFTASKKDATIAQMVKGVSLPSLVKELLQSGCSEKVVNTWLSQLKKTRIDLAKCFQGYDISASGQGMGLYT